MNEIEGMKWHLGSYRAILSRQIDRLSNALEELQRTTLLLLETEVCSDEAIDSWLEKDGFSIDSDGFYQSIPLLQAHREGRAPEDAVSISWGEHLRTDSQARERTFIHRNIGTHLKHIRDRLGDVGWIYYQDAANISLQFPFIDQCNAITSDFEWSTYHTYVSVSPENNPQRIIQWTPPSIDYAGEGLILSVSIPVYHNDLFIGLWSIDLPVRYLYRDFASARVLPQNEQFIADNKGMLILHDHFKAEVDQSKGKIFLHSVKELANHWHQIDITNFFSKDEGEFHLTDDTGTDWLFCYTTVPGVQWILFSGVPAPAMEEAAALRLSQAFEEIGAGNFSHQIESSSLNALPTLVEEFNKMSIRLSQATKQRNEIEGQLRQAQKMEAVGRLAGGVAHDYNNIITVIMGYAEMALERINPNDPLSENLTEIYDAGKRSMDLTRQLLAFARRQAVKPKVLNINDVVNTMLKMLQRMIGEDIKIHWQPHQDIWSVEIDPTQIDQILANLCVNARDAISGVGNIHIETANVELDEHFCALHCGASPGDYVRLRVGDDGIGIDEKVIDKIFEPFFSTKAIGRGTGLGLATVYGIVKQNGGYVNVYSEPGRGTTFNIFLPRTIDATTAFSTKGAQVVHSGKGERILLVEDDLAILNLTEKMLRKLGYQVHAVDSPIAAIHLSENSPEPFDLLLTDVIMPELNGRDLAQRIVDLFPEVEVLFMSGYSADTITHQGVLDDDVMFLDKPFSIAKLSASIRNVLGTD